MALNFGVQVNVATRSIIELSCYISGRLPISPRPHQPTLSLYLSISLSLSSSLFLFYSFLSLNLPRPFFPASQPFSLFLFQSFLTLTLSFSHVFSPRSLSVYLSLLFSLSLSHYPFRSFSQKILPKMKDTYDGRYV